MCVKLKFNNSFIRLKRYENRKSFVLTFVKKEDDVLDIGCAQQAIIDGKKQYLEKFIKDHSNSCLGIDINPVEVRKMAAKGYDVSNISIYDFNVGMKFDVIYAGEVIEHLSDLKTFLQKVRVHLKNSGVFICDVPNAIYESIRLLLPVGDFSIYGHYPIHRKGGHVHMFHPYLIMQLLENENFQVLEIGMIKKRNTEKMLPRILWRSIGFVARPI